MYTDRHGKTWEHNHPSKRTGRSGCPECNARNRDSKHKRDRERGLVKDSGKVARMAAWTPAERLAHERRQQSEASARYRTEHGRPHDHRYPGKNTTALRADWLRRGIDPAVCFYCPAPAEHADHYFPRARGGSDEFHNLVPACAPCNYRKNDKLPIEWLATRLAAS